MRVLGTKQVVVKNLWGYHVDFQERIPKRGNRAKVLRQEAIGLLDKKKRKQKSLIEGAQDWRKDQRK